MIQVKDQRFTLQTKNTEYIFEILYDKYLVHLYYGGKTAGETVYSSRYKAFSPFTAEHGTTYSPDTCMAEFSGFGNGDFRATSLKLKNKNGDSVCSFEYRSHRIFAGRIELPGLPYADANADTETLEVSLLDPVTGCGVQLYYTVFPKEDVISRYAVIENRSGGDAVIEKSMSLLLDLPGCEYDMISLYGGHNNERHYQRRPLFHGNQSIGSRRGASSHQFNPFIALCDHHATETAGEVYGFNFVYSGNFLDEVEVDQLCGTRVQLGLGSENFSWLLKDGERFTTPEAVMTFSAAGIGQMSRNFHAFTRNHILPPEPFEQRPVVLNTWEACYFNIDEAEMLRFAEAAAECGTDMVVMDDGWFGARNNDKAGLGDWFENKEKFKDGLAAFVDRMKAKGIKFGIWIEPEMVNPDSELYRAHPEWCLQVKGRESLLSRHQLVLDMGNPAVIDYLKESFSKTFEGVALDYFKWDMNRHLSEVGSTVLPPERQGEAAYRHMLGVYELFRWFKEKYPHAMIENCSGGGGRYDLGMMKFSTMIWTSDNTHPKPRIKIQYSSLLAYPAATMSCHVSNPKNVCADPDVLKFRWQVAVGGALGYELHLPDALQEIKDTVKKQIADYRVYEDLILRGDYYPLCNPYETEISAFYYANGDHSRILLSALQNSSFSGHFYTLSVPGAQPDAVYYDAINDLTLTGRQLIVGIRYSTVDKDPTGKMWYFVKQ
ncbi:MAG: alpha-galactosidase [Clostridia bacterium]|nr:alpha-galactosidase [Clostridia bacterium]